MNNVKREIKFRGKSARDKTWLYGDLIQESPVERYIRRRFDESRAMNADYQSYEWDVNEPVYPESIGQFTGLKDANGVDIYEGDILVDEKKYLFLIVARNKDGLWILEDMCGIPIRLDKTPITVREYVSDWNATIAGNKHENRELLEQHDN